MLSAQANHKRRACVLSLRLSSFVEAEVLRMMKSWMGWLYRSSTTTRRRRHRLFQIFENASIFPPSIDVRVSVVVGARRWRRRRRMKRPPPSLPFQKNVSWSGRSACSLISLLSLESVKKGRFDEPSILSKTVHPASGRAGERTRKRRIRKGNERTNERANKRSVG